MNKNAKIAIFTVNLILCAAIVLLTAFLMGGWGIAVCVIFYCIAGAGIATTLISFFLNKQAILKSAFVLLICAAVFLAAFIAVSEIAHIENYETTEEKIQALKEIINKTGAWGMVIYVLIQILQVVILPLPALVCYMPGVLLWNPLTATLLASVGVLIGSVINYFIGRIWGKKAVVWIAGKETTEKYSAYLAKRGKVLFVLMQILPFFPDDILCMVAGLTSMNFPFFMAVMVLVRPFIIAAYCYLGSGTIIPFNEPWGIAVWIAIFAVCIALAVLSFLYQERVEKWFVEKISNLKDRKNKKSGEHIGENNEKNDNDNFAENGGDGGENTENNSENKA